LRWQRPSEPHGYFGLKDPILMRTAKDPNYKPDWSNWGAQDRNALWNAKAKITDERFSTVITGPWMNRWKITHHNNNTKHFIPDNESQWHKS